MLTIADLDQHLSRQGHFCLVDWLLAKNLLLYPDYEAWRYGRETYLAEKLCIDKPTLQGLLADTENHGKALGLCTETQDFYAWDADMHSPLRISPRSQIHLQLSQKWLRPQDLPQLDLFMDNAATIAENCLRDSLRGRQFDAAQQQLAELSRLNAQHPLLGRFQDLVNYGQHMQAEPCISESALVAEALGLQQEVIPLAQEVLGQAARDYLAYAWRRLAESLANSQTGSRFNPQAPELHASYALAQIPDWQGVRDCLESDPCLYQHPELLARLAGAQAALQQREQALLLWAALFERYPQFAESEVGEQGPASTRDLWQEFAEAEESLGEILETPWFAAYILVREPGLIRHLESLGQPLPPLQHPASTAMVALLQARQANTDQMPARRQLKAINPLLLQLYMSD